MRIDVVDNGGQWTHREWRMLRDLGIDSEIIPNTTAAAEITADGLVLSGGAPRISSDIPKLGLTDKYLDEVQIPVLAICVGHQYMAIHFGGEAGPARVPEYGKAEIIITEPDDLFKGLPERFTIWVSHNDEVTRLPEGFINLAYSRDCAVQAMKHEERPLYGVQFHPEVEHTEYHYEIFTNFIEAVTGSNP
ncbi:GMP synthase subunit A [candidate division WOR-3 bacterium]|uniref:GMP synthetase n=1 Tax=candidate division WOR-3 bacterium TaxID=2052148 RepID=A0A9D5K9T2_UNCW3|nr:GMP synthase subunit A [candidate division WOR-3 bacterium]MBD3365118.1 GMP synthase subunit A [candidate division WOR-3 bacterium]